MTSSLPIYLTKAPIVGSRRNYAACKQCVTGVSASIMWEDGISGEISLTLPQSVTLSSGKLLGFLLILVVLNFRESSGRRWICSNVSSDFSVHLHIGCFSYVSGI